MDRLGNKTRTGTFWRQIIRWRGTLATFSMALLSVQTGFVLFKANITPFDQEAWRKRENRSAFVTDLEWNRLKRGETMHQVREILGEPDSQYWMGTASYEDVYFLGQGNRIDRKGILYLAYDHQGRLEVARIESLPADWNPAQ